MSRYENNEKFENFVLRSEKRKTLVKHSTYRFTHGTSKIFKIYNLYTGRNNSV